MPAPAPSGLDPRLPVLVGVGQLNVRVDRGDEPLEPVAMLAEAARRAGADAGVGERLLARVDTIDVVDILSWRYRDPGALVGARIGARPRRSRLTVAGGNYPQTLVSQAAVDIASGTADVVLIGGAEAWRTRSAARRTGDELAWTVQDDDVAALFAGLEPDDRVELLDELPASVALRLMRGLPARERDMTAGILGYPPGSIGRRMSPEFVALRANLTAGQALSVVTQRLADAETVYTLPVTDDQRAAYVAASAAVGGCSLFCIGDFHREGRESADALRADERQQQTPFFILGGLR